MWLYIYISDYLTFRQRVSVHRARLAYVDPRAPCQVNDEATKITIYAPARSRSLGVSIYSEVQTDYNFAEETLAPTLKR